MSLDVPDGEEPVTSREFLKSHLEASIASLFGVKDKSFIDGVVDAWMNDADNSRNRFEAIEEELPGARRILDLASGCGTCVYYGLINGYDVYGIEPERWKHLFNGMKAKENGYPDEWQQRFCVGVGEALPYRDDSFECVTIYQTLEHVQDPESVLMEMLRVTKPGGGIHIRCPDYRGTFEGHYRLPWLPLFPRPLAKLYLRVFRRPTAGLDTLNYVTKTGILKLIRKAQQRQSGLQLQIVDRDRTRFSHALERRSLPNWPGIFGLYKIARYIKVLFRFETNVDLFIHIKGGV